MHIHAKCLEMRDVNRHARLPPDVDRFASGVQQAEPIRGLVALVSVVDAAANRRLARQRHDLVGGGETLRRIEQAG